MGEPHGLRQEASGKPPQRGHGKGPPTPLGVGQRQVMGNPKLQRGVPVSEQQGRERRGTARGGRGRRGGDAGRVTGKRVQDRRGEEWGQGDGSRVGGRKVRGQRGHIAGR